MNSNSPLSKKWYDSFTEWRTAAVEQVFGLQRSENLPALEKWLLNPAEQYPCPPTIDLETWRKNLIRFHFSWNEYELMAGFIGPVLASISFVGQHYAIFHQRELALDYEGQHTEGKVDGLVALGAFDPEMPFFFIHEYKRSQGFDADPEGQLLIAMVAAQHLNNDGQPMYGCYIVGTYWRFVLLEGKQYAVSQGYDATDPTELRIIWRILHHTKLIIEERVAAILAAIQNQ